MKDYAIIKNQIYSGVLGKLIGVYLGRPIEGWSYRDIQRQFGTIQYYVHRQLGLPLIVADDDISGTFGFFRALSNVYTGFAPLVALKLPSSLYNMLPYIISLVVLAFISQKSRAPKAEGIPYDKGQR